MQQRCDLSHTESPVPYLLEVLVTVDVLLVMGVLQLVGLDVLPEGLDDAGASLSVNTKQASQARVQLELGGLRGRHNRITTLFCAAAHLGAFTSSHLTSLSFPGFKMESLMHSVMFLQTALSAVRGLQVVTTAADFMAWISHRQTDGLFVDGVCGALTW